MNNSVSEVNYYIHTVILMSLNMVEVTLKLSKMKPLHATEITREERTEHYSHLQIVEKHKYGVSMKWRRKKILPSFAHEET